MSNSGKLDPKGKIIKALKIAGIVLGGLVALVIAYFLYVFAFYHRIPDHQKLEITQPVSQQAELQEKVTTGEEYTIVTYNVGFGAYSPSFSFFMDGGRSSWAASKQSAENMITGAGNLCISFEPDFVLFQEVDVDSTRTYHLNELNLLNNMFTEYDSTFAVNYDSAFLLYPLYEPHGSSYAGIATYSRYRIASAERRSLPVSADINRYLDLDRCYSINRFSVDDGKELVIINIHMSAYGSSEAVRAGQTAMLREDMEREYLAGNYVIVGGDFNHNLKLYDDDNNYGWAHAYDRTLLPEGFAFVIDSFEEEAKQNLHNTCRDAGKPYNVASSTVTLDGFIISENIVCIEYQQEDYGYAYSDHDPVVMKFVLGNTEEH